MQVLQQAAQKVCSGSVAGMPAASSAFKQEWMQQPAAQPAQHLAAQASSGGAVACTGIVAIPAPTPAKASSAQR